MSKTVTSTQRYDDNLTDVAELSTLRFNGLVTIGERILDDLIYSFLLQSDFPRASIVFDVDLLNPVSQRNGGIKVPSFIIVDPDTAQPLAVIEVVDAIDGEELKEVAIESGAYAARLGNQSIQGFLIRVDVRGRTEAEQVQFYRIWPNSTLQRLSSKNFPDLASLKVFRKLVENNAARIVAEMPQLLTKPTSDKDDSGKVAAGAGLYLPAFFLLLLILADSLFFAIQGINLLTVPQSLLAFGAAVLFTLPAAIRYLRR